MDRSRIELLPNRHYAVRSDALYDVNTKWMCRAERIICSKPCVENSLGLFMFDGVPKIDYIHRDFSSKRCMSKNISLDNLAGRQNLVEVVFIVSRSE